MKLNSYDMGLLCLFGMLLFSIYGQVQTERDLDRAQAEVKRLQVKVQDQSPIVAKLEPSEICPAWWFGQGSVQEAKRQICGRKG